MAISWADRDEKWASQIDWRACGPAEVSIIMEAGYDAMRECAAHTGYTVSGVRPQTSSGVNEHIKWNTAEAVRISLESIAHEYLRHLKPLWTPLRYNERGLRSHRQMYSSSLLPFRLLSRWICDGNTLFCYAVYRLTYKNPYSYGASIVDVWEPQPTMYCMLYIRGISIKRMPWWFCLAFFAHVRWYRPRTDKPNSN